MVQIGHTLTQDEASALELVLFRLLQRFDAYVGWLKRLWSVTNLCHSFLCVVSISKYTELLCWDWSFDLDGAWPLVPSCSVVTGTALFKSSSSLVNCTCRRIVGNKREIIVSVRPNRVGPSTSFSAYDNIMTAAVYCLCNTFMYNSNVLHGNQQTTTL